MTDLPHAVDRVDRDGPPFSLLVGRHTTTTTPHIPPGGGGAGTYQLTYICPKCPSVQTEVLDSASGVFRLDRHAPGRCPPPRPSVHLRGCGRLTGRLAPGTGPSRPAIPQARVGPVTSVWRSLNRRTADPVVEGPRPSKNAPTASPSRFRPPPVTGAGHRWGTGRSDVRRPHGYRTSARHRRGSRTRQSRQSVTFGATRGYGKEIGAMRSG
jgi:hypothetical protein